VSAGAARACRFCDLGAHRSGCPDADRIAQLTAELADARAQLAKVRHDRDEMIRVHDEVERDRDALRGEIERTKAELAEARDHRACQMAVSHAAADVQRRCALYLSEARCERDAAIAREQAAQAEAAAMRYFISVHRHHSRTQMCGCGYCVDASRHLATNEAGRVLLECHAAEIEALKADNDRGLRALAARVQLLEVVAKVARFWGLHDSELAKALAALDAKDGS
jgi:tRNA nucleotidyltransferase (CCA-adding enzyme)